MSHFKKVCQFGVIHSQCRCASPTKTVETITCDRPDAHRVTSPLAIARTLTGNHCVVHGSHRPTPIRTVKHHIWPEGEGGPTVDENLLLVCDTGHYNIHALLEQLRRGQEMTGGTREERRYAALGIDRIRRQAL